MELKITDKKFAVQTKWQWDADDEKVFFDTIEEATEFFKTKMIRNDKAIIVAKVAIVYDETVKDRAIRVENV